MEHPKSARFQWRVIVIVLEVLVALVVAGALWALRQQTLRSELATLASLSAAMAAQADGVLDIANATLETTRQELSKGMLVPQSYDTHGLLQARVAGLPKFRALGIVDAQGMRVATSRGDPAPPVSSADRDFFLAARDGPPGQIFIAQPRVSRSDGQPSIAVSKDWRDSDGQFRGAVVLLADPEFLDGDFDRIAPTDDTSLAIYRRDRALVSDGPGDGSAKLLPRLAMERLWQDPHPEVPRLLQIDDGHGRLVAAHMLRSYPLMVVVTRDATLALADWRRQCGFAAFAAGIAMLLTAWLSARIGREQARREAVESVLLDEQQRASRAFQAAREGYVEWNIPANKVSMSPRMKELLGLPRGADVGRAEAVPQEGLHPEDLATLRAHWRDVQRGGPTDVSVVLRVGDGPGDWRHVQLRGHVERDDQGQARIFHGTAVDISTEVRSDLARRRLHDQLQQARKLEALGNLAGGVAHDFNNILAAVIGYGELARDEAKADSKQSRHLDQILQAGYRGKSVVERILSFSRGSPRKRVVFLAQPVVSEVAQTLRASLAPHVRVELALEAPDAAIEGDPTQFYEAVMNLCTNALQALAGHGQVTVSLRTTHPTAPLKLSEGELAAGHYLVVGVSDNGPGIPDDIRSRLFEPFFTTKGPRHGTGLGLAIVHGVTEELGGAIDVQSEPGSGSAFFIHVPLSAQPVNDASAQTRELPLGNGQTVLVVDDEPGLVRLAEEMLAGLGYEPFGLASSREALQALQAEPERFDILLTDEVMPQLSGTALAEAARTACPKLIVLLATGWGGEKLEQRAAEAGVCACLSKPLTRSEMAWALHDALQRAGRLQM
ncbi:ATP-binding protein [Roseateles sp.]|uniref:ATP-binding protein n=1 Tax=Roseateles sp. TaxID=1971397 RepID=UPI0025CE619C|nr:ATP-binding protein [Roseateles sp.]MBV8036539.1 response regulator [Roseateles sp.]